MYTTSDSDFPEAQILERAHAIGCHHLAASKNGLKLASAGFEGKIKLWDVQEEKIVSDGEILGTMTLQLLETLC